MEKITKLGEKMPIANSYFLGFAFSLVITTFGCYDFFKNNDPIIIVLGVAIATLIFLTRFFWPEGIFHFLDKKDKENFQSKVVTFVVIALILFFYSISPNGDISFAAAAGY
jgi:heme/copper-type cytochrome/quinol oxidase subunit 4